MKALQLQNALMNVKQLYISQIRPISFLSTKKESSSKEEEETSEEPIPTFIEDAEDLAAKESEVNRKRNVSRLLPQHRNMLNEAVPYNRSESWVHETAKYKRTMFGRYGLASGVNPAICFPSKAEVVENSEYERVAFPHTLPEMIAINKHQKSEKVAEIQEREDKIAKKMEKLEQWKQELYAKVAKKESDAKAAKARKDRLVEDVRRHFGYKVDPREDRFKEMLELKEKEDKKKMKEEKRKAKETKLITKLTSKNEKSADPGQASPTSPPTAEK